MLAKQRQAIEKMASKFYEFRDQLDDYENEAEEDLPEDAQERLDAARTKLEDWASEIETMAAEIDADL